MYNWVKFGILIMSKQVAMSVDTANDKVYVQFDRQLDYIELSPQQAVELADVIVRKAMAINPGSALILPPTLN